MTPTFAVAITTFNRAETVARLLRSIEGWTASPSQVVVVDNSPAPSGVRHLVDSYHHFPENIGLPGALTVAFRAVPRTASHVLVLDDDTVLASDTAARLVERCVGGVGAVSIPRDFTRRHQMSAGGPVRLFPWSPTVLDVKAIRSVDPPRRELFFGFDDWDYALRIYGAGYGVIWLEAELPSHSMASTWPGRAYLSARNLAYLLVHCRVRDRVFFAPTKNVLRGTTVGRSSRVLRRGLRDGLRRRMGPPPVDLLPPGSG